MCDNIITDYKMITGRGGCHDDIVLDLYNALLLGKNNIFNRFIERSKENWEVGVDQAHTKLVCQPVTKYNNRVKQGRWKQMDSKDTTIVAINNQTTNLEKKHNNGINLIKTKSTPTGSRSSSNPHTRNRFTLDAWRIKFEGIEKVVDGSTWYWCKHHKMDDVYNEMYIIYPKDKYDA